MCNEHIKNRKDQKEYFETYINNFNSAKDFMPEVLRMYEITSWEFNVLSTIKDNNDWSTERSQQLKKFHNDEFENLKQRLPMIPEIKASDFNRTAGTITTGSYTTNEILDNCYNNRTIDSGTYFDLVTKYEGIQEKYSQIDIIRSKLISISKYDLIERFNLSYESYQMHNSGSTDISETANHMRNFLQGFKGVLWEKAKHHHGENMTWEIMGQRLIRKGYTDIEYTSLIVDQQKIHSDLLSALALLLKKMDHNSNLVLSNTWTDYLDHIYSVLNLLA